MAFYKRLDVLILLMLQSDDLGGAMNIFRTQMFHQRNSYEEFVQREAGRLGDR